MIRIMPDRFSELLSMDHAWASTTVLSLDEESSFEGQSGLCYQSSYDQLYDWALIQQQSASPCWVVNLHGHGSSGDQLYTRKDICENWLPLFKQYDCNIVTPNLRGNAWMGPAAVADLHELLKYLRVHHQARKFIFVGGSMGGTSCLIYAICHPQDVDAVIAMCSATDIGDYARWCRRNQDVNETIHEIADAIEASYGGSPDEQPQAYFKHNVLGNVSKLKMPVAIAHGDADAVIPVEQAQSLAAKLVRHAHFKYDELPDGDHDAPLMNLRSLFEFILKSELSEKI